MPLPDYLAQFVDVPNPYRACQLCTHGRGPRAERRCAEPEVQCAHGSFPPVALVRTQAGHCGPEANRLDFPGLHQH